MSNGLPGPCSRCAGLRQKHITPGSGAVQPYCKPCFREYARVRREKQRKGELPLRPCTRCGRPGTPGQSLCHEHKNEVSRDSHARVRDRKRADARAAAGQAGAPAHVHRQPRQVKPSQRFSLDPSNARGGTRAAAGKRPVNAQAVLVLHTSPELTALLDELVQLSHFGTTREAVALMLLRQRGEREALFWHDLVAPVVAELR